MKKIEAVIDPAALEDVRFHLAEAGIDGRITVAEVSALENLGRFYQIQTSRQNPWKPCLRVDLIVSDRKTESAVNIILQHANLAGQHATGGQRQLLPSVRRHEPVAGPWRHQRHQLARPRSAANPGSA